ncbi:hypothetical protein [Roseimaritima sediminicola]|uniref:hypothetical protein n=1 Tax=Roseimaritima sediminicola TaxID=2662066 RepID=UPI0012983B12|nr:hypothetical protein [Roseimaritima sediminicola]
MTKPIFRNCDDIGPSELASFPVWVYCHLTDYDEPWYEDVDDEAYRAWTDDSPIGNDTVAIVAASFRTHAGILLQGFIETWGDSTGNPVLDLKPTIFDADGHRIALWHGATYQFGTDHLDDCIARFERLLGGSMPDHFPVRVEVKANVFGDALTDSLPGFASFSGPGETTVINGG